ncbi:MAG: signal peptidase II [Lactobacillales bacterium]|nr:signal peptidase II [Lactobacillales bacterium]
MIYAITLLTILLDQISKYVVLKNMDTSMVMPVFPHFNLVLVYNRGVSFSMFSSDGDVMPYVLSALALAICAGIIYWIRIEKDTWVRYALAMILGGAIGNIIDRLRFGSVVDFLDVYYLKYHWPAFNIADAAICVGVFLIVFLTLFMKGKK